MDQSTDIINPIDTAEDQGEVAIVRAEINRQQNPRSSAVNNIITLAVSIFLFMSMGLISASITDIVILAGVLLVHEMGHLAAMKIFGYRNLSILFIPFFGAAASGIETQPGGASRAVVDLMGPIPGIIAGIVLMFVYIAAGNALLLKIAVTALAINGFNLLPFYPLDGGRFFDDVLFNRNMYVEIIFKAATVLAFFVLAVVTKDWFIGIFVVFIVLSIPTTKRIAALAHHVRNDGIMGGYGFSEQIPDSFIGHALPIIRNAVPSAARNAKLKAIYIIGAWKKLFNRPPSAVKTAALTLGYFVLVLVTALFLITSIVIKERAAPHAAEKSGVTSGKGPAQK